MLEIEYKFFLEHKEKLIKKYLNKFIVIVGKEVVGVYNDKLTALKDSVSKYEQGTFFIEFCTNDDSFYNWTFINWVVA